MAVDEEALSLSLKPEAARESCVFAVEDVESLSALNRQFHFPEQGSCAASPAYCRVCLPGSVVPTSRRDWPVALRFLLLKVQGESSMYRCLREKLTFTQQKRLKGANSISGCRLRKHLLRTYLLCHHRPSRHSSASVGLWSSNTGSMLGRNWNLLHMG